MSWLDRALRLVSTVLPFGLALLRAAPTAQWRDDLPAVRDLGLVAVGIGGGVSTLLTQALSLVPLGSRSFRAAFGAALALALAARLFHELCRRLLLAVAEASAARPAPAGNPPRLPGVLATIATLTAALSPTWQREGTVGGGAMLAVALSFAALTLALIPAQLPTAQKKDSQGICFIGEVKMADFLKTYVPDHPGPIIRAIDGKVRFLEGDVTDRSTLADALAGQDAVVHYAAETGTCYLVRPDGHVLGRWRHADRIQHHRGVGRHLHGHRGHEGVAHQSRGHR